jgi:thioredoxin-like negative regulator of GroEL
VENAQNRIDYFERMLADNPENPTGLLALANEYKKAGREEDEAAVLKRYVEAHEDERSGRQHESQITFRTRLTGDGAGAIEFVGARGDV